MSSQLLGMLSSHEYQLALVGVVKTDQPDMYKNVMLQTEFALLNYHLPDKGLAMVNTETFNTYVRHSIPPKRTCHYWF
jgi:hypothetical protein